MLAIARGLMAKPRLLLLDEPSLGLAPQVVNDLFAALDRLRAEAATILLVDQMAGLALSLADRALAVESTKAGAARVARIGFVVVLVPLVHWRRGSATGKNGSHWLALAVRRPESQYGRVPRLRELG